MKIICKTTLIPAPTFTGTRLAVRAEDGARTFAVNAATKAPGSEAIRVDWGDGTFDAVAGDIVRLTHDYAASGDYEVSISDDIASLAVVGSEDAAGCAAMIVRAQSNARALETLEAYCLKGCKNLAEIDFARSAVRTIGQAAFNACSGLVSAGEWPGGLVELGNTCFYNCTALASLRALPSGVTTLKNAVFGLCASIGGRVDLPGVANLAFSSAGVAPFKGCTGIEEIHFAKAHEESIKASRGYAVAPTLGAANATVAFDL